MGKLKKECSLSAETEKAGMNPGETDTLSIYLKQISIHPLLSREQETVLGRDIQNLKDDIRLLEIKYRNNEIRLDIYKH